jgi:tetratricopeptide (TPR) repeat protein
MQQGAAHSRIVDAIKRADRSTALAVATDAWNAGDRTPLVLMLAAEQLEDDGRAEEALALLREAVDAERDEPELWRRFAIASEAAGNLEDALHGWDEAVDLDWENVAILLGAAGACFRSGALDRAEKHYREAAELAPTSAEPVAGLAAIAVRLQRLEQGRELADQALSMDINNSTAGLARARADLALGEPAAALNRVVELLARTDIAAEQTIGLLDLQAEALDRLDRPEESMTAVGTRNALLRARYAGEAAKAEPKLDEARRLYETYRNRPTLLRARDGGSDEDPVFLVGFPRSGTTLLEKALAGHPQLVTLPEIDCLSEAGAHFFADDRGLEQLAQLDEDMLASLRDRYWAATRAAVGQLERGQRVVDKMPLHTLYLPLIQALFPKAKILFAIRDPRDVVLSCFRRRFRMNAAMYEFLDLERAAAFYDAVMRLGSLYRAQLPLSVREVRHEAVVADFDGEISAVLAFLGLDWDDGVRDFAGRAKAMMRTPSDLQLIGGLSAEGVGQWRRFQAPLTPVMPMIQPWVEQFGYER